MSSDIHWEMSPLPGGGWKGTIRLPVVGPLSGRSVVSASASGPTKADALLKAGGIADQIINNPVISALLPPGSALALEATKRIARAVKGGAAGDVIRQIGGAAGQRLATALLNF